MKFNRIIEIGNNNIAVVTSSMPVTGMQLPFFSYGGTALFLLLCEMGVLLSISRASSKQ